MMGSSLNRNQRYHDAGFTIIEFIIVILIIGIIAAIVIPWFLSSADNARQATTNSVGMSLTAAANANFALSKSYSNKAVTISNCQDVANALPPSQPLPAGYSIVPGALTEGQQATCTLAGPGGTVTTFTAIGSS